MIDIYSRKDRPLGYYYQSANVVIAPSTSVIMRPLAVFLTTHTHTNTHRYICLSLYLSIHIYIYNIYIYIYLYICMYLYKDILYRFDLTFMNNMTAGAGKGEDQN